MLRLALLLLSLAASAWTSTHAGIGGGWDPNGRTATAPTPDSGGGWDPNG